MTTSQDTPALNREHDYFSKAEGGGGKVSFFERDPEKDVVIMGASGMSEVPESVREAVDLDTFWDGRMRIQPLVVHPEDDGFSLGCYTFEPNFTMPRHHHDTDQVVMVIDGELRQGKRVLKAGSGFFTKAGSAYGFKVGPKGCTICEFRHVTNFATTFVEDNPARWVHGVTDEPAQ